jgi:phosphopantothenate-cysteine ligase
MRRRSGAGCIPYTPARTFLLNLEELSNSSNCLLQRSAPLRRKLALVQRPDLAGSMDVATTAEVEGFYFECPASSVEAQQQIAEFFRHHAPNGRLERPVVCVTSGGTTVPMERNCVRYIDNFSAGTRGAMSTQEFLEARHAPAAFAALLLLR